MIVRRYPNSDLNYRFRWAALQLDNIRNLKILRRDAVCLCDLLCDLTSELTVQAREREGLECAFRVLDVLDSGFISYEMFALLVKQLRGIKEVTIAKAHAFD